MNTIKGVLKFSLLWFIFVFIWYLILAFIMATFDVTAMEGGIKGLGVALSLMLAIFLWMFED